MRRILHLYDLNQNWSLREYVYADDNDVEYVGWFHDTLEQLSRQQCKYAISAGIRQVWTYETERSPRLCQWFIDEHQSVTRGLEWIPPTEFLLSGWKPDMAFHFVYQIKKALKYTTYDVYVSYSSWRASHLIA